MNKNIHRLPSLSLSAQVAGLCVPVVAVAVLIAFSYWSSGPYWN